METRELKLEIEELAVLLFDSFNAPERFAGKCLANYKRRLADVAARSGLPVEWIMVLAEKAEMEYERAVAEEEAADGCE